MSTTIQTVLHTTAACQMTLFVEGEGVETPLVLFQDCDNQEHGVELAKLEKNGFTREFLTKTRPNSLIFFLHQIQEANGVITFAATCWLKKYTYFKTTPLLASLFEQERSNKTVS